MEWVETTAEDVEQAKELALDRLGVDASEAEFVVTQEPRKGVLGIGRVEARVRARVRPTRPRPKQERRSRKSRSRRREERPARSAGSSAGSAPQAPPGDSSPTERPARAGSGTKRREPERAGSGSRNGKDSKPQEGESMDGEMTLNEQGELAVEFLRGLTEQFDFDADITTSPIDDDNLEVQVNGEDLGLLIGPRGQTLTAIQELTKTVLQRRATQGARGRVRVDVSGYRERRREALAEFTRKVAQEVIDSGESQALEPMNAADRKTVHDTINEIDGVDTISEGTDPRRRVVVVLAD